MTYHEPLRPAPLKVNGVGRLHDPDEPDQAARALVVYFNREPTDDELRAFHDAARGFAK